MKVSVFGTVLKTMRLFERDDTLGRQLSWSFNAPQLLVVPRAGEWTNAYYERDSHSLQFFYFPSVRPPYETVYTSLSHDIVAHETGHAILDGIAPDLYNAVTPQSLALHEAVADLTALMMAFKSPNLSERRSRTRPGRDRRLVRLQRDRRAIRQRTRRERPEAVSPESQQRQVARPHGVREGRRRSAASRTP